MPTVSQFFQPPLYWQEFENLAHGMLGEIYNIPNAQQYGRPGQAQNGVDVFGESAKYGWIGVQCKRLADTDKHGKTYPGGAFDEAFLRKEAQDAMSFKPDLSMWILATTARRDAKVQDWVNTLNLEWKQAGMARRAMVWAWDDCISHLNAHPDLQRWYYEEVIKIRGTADLDRVILETFAMAFSRPAFRVPLHCESDVEFLQALSDTQRAVSTGELLDRESRHVIRKAVGGWQQLADPIARDDVHAVDTKLSTLVIQIKQGLKDGRITKARNFLDFKDQAFGHYLDHLRHECLAGINSVLMRAGLPGI